MTDTTTEAGDAGKAEPDPPDVAGTGRELERAGSPPMATGTMVAGPAAPRPTREVLVPLDADAVIAGMDAYQSLLPRLLDDTDYQGTGSDRFVKKSGWRKIARAFNLSVEIVSISVERDGLGKPTRAECIARAVAPNGQIQDADGYCTISEFTGRRADDVKLENTLRATATTRAKNRAIADLVGMGEVSAEETEQAGTPPPPFGPPVNAVRKGAATRALTFLLDSDAEAVWTDTVADARGYMPAVVAETICRIARTLAARDVDAKADADNKPEAEPDPPPAAEPDGEPPAEPAAEAPPAEPGADPLRYDPADDEAAER